MSCNFGLVCCVFAAAAGLGQLRDIVPQKIKLGTRQVRGIGAVAGRAGSWLGPARSELRRSCINVPSPLLANGDRLLLSMLERPALKASVRGHPDSFSCPCSIRTASVIVHPPREGPVQAKFVCSSAILVISFLFTRRAKDILNRCGCVLFPALLFLSSARKA